MEQWLKNGGGKGSVMLGGRGDKGEGRSQQADPGSGNDGAYAVQSERRGGTKGAPLSV